MNPRVLTAVSAWLAILIPSQGCGPFFPDTVLDNPQAALSSPPVSYLHSLYRMVGKPLPPAGSDEDNADRSFFLRQVPSESAELREIWINTGIEDPEIQRRIALYESVREKLLAPISIAGPMDFPTHDGQPLELPVRPLGAEFPADVADYVEAARLHAIGNTEQARGLWKSILERPLTERRLRSAWAAWMLAKTSKEKPECFEWYARVETEVQAGATDVLHLQRAAKGWRASLTNDPIESVHLFYEVFIEGNSDAAIDLRQASAKIFNAEDPNLLATAAADPLVRRLVNLNLYASLDGPEQVLNEAGEVVNKPFPWFAALEAHAPKTIEEGANVAWALYSIGRYEEARRWLSLSVKTEALALWLQAKFDLRDGNLEAADKHLAEAIRLKSKEEDWHPVNQYDEFLWYADAPNIESQNQSRLLADAGIVSLAREDYLPALEALRKGNFREDAAYLAECVISTDGLIKHVRKVAPKWIPVVYEQQESPAPIDPYTCLQSGAAFSTEGIGTDNQLRYLLARRLAREKRLKEAREFMPPELLAVLDHYIALDRARRSGRFSGEAQAAVIWRQALIHRHLGAELFSTDGAPDGGAHDWNFTATPFPDIRTLSGGWSHDWSQDPPYGPAVKPEEQAVPKISADEISRAQRFSLQKLQRFHYRYTAADLAWEAAKALPANHPLLPQLYNTAGQWLSNTDPKAADRFYQAMVRRCAKTPEGQAADAKHWFLAELAALEDLPALPQEFKGDSKDHNAP